MTRKAILEKMFDMPDDDVAWIAGMGIELIAARFGGKVPTSGDDE